MPLPTPEISFTWTWLDAAVLAILAAGILIGYCRGLVMALMGVLRSFLSLALTYWLYPYASAFLKSNTGLSAWISEKITPFVAEKLLGLGIEAAQTQAQQTGLLNGLPLPDFLKTTLLGGNNPEIYSLFNLSGLQDYVVTFLTDMIINIIALLSVFVLSFILMRFVMGIFSFITKLPVISTVNKWAGAVCGFAQAVLLIWILFLISSFFIADPGMAWFFDQLQTSVAAKFLYETNWLLKMAARFIGG